MRSIDRGGIGFGWVRRWIANLVSRVRFPPMPPKPEIYVKFHPEWTPKWVVRDGKRLGPFMYSTQWTRVEDQEAAMFGKNADAWREKLRAEAYNKAYDPPQNHIHLAREVIQHLEREAEKYKAQAIDARKEVSRLRRGAP